MARIARAHGLRGGLLLEAETDQAEALFQPGRRLRIVGGTAPLDRLTVTSARPHQARWLLETDEVVDRTMAEGLRGASLSVPRGELPGLAEDEYLLHDLIGMTVVESGSGLGRVSEVYEFPGGPMLEVEIGGRERLIPFEKGIVDRVDLENRSIHVTLPKGLLDV